jgi:hypothetical protein
MSSDFGKSGRKLSLSVRQKKSMKTLFYIFLLIIPLFSQSKIYHLIESTASGPKIVEYNIKWNKGIKNYLIETIDSEGRVIKLQFFIDNEPADFLQYCPTTIEYQYAEMKIIEKYFYGKNEEIPDFFHYEVPYQTEYELDKNNNVISSKDCYKIEFNSISRNEIGRIKKHIDSYFEVIKDWEEDSVNYQKNGIQFYIFSTSKLSGYNPKIVE